METEDIISRAIAFGAIQIPEEMASLVELLKKHAPRNVMEIGSEAGGTFYVLCRLATLGGIKISLDLPTGSSGSGRFRDQEALAERSKKMKRWSANVHVVTGDSHEQRCRQAVEDILGREKLDFLFIDGDHSYCGVKLDFEDYCGFVRPGGLIAFHDINDSEFHRTRGCEVAKFWAELKVAKEHETRTSGSHCDRLVQEFNQGLDWGGIGVVRV